MGNAGKVTMVNGQCTCFTFMHTDNLWKVLPTCVHINEIVHAYNPVWESHFPEGENAIDVKPIWGNLSLKLSSRCLPWYKWVDFHVLMIFRLDWLPEMLTVSAKFCYTNCICTLVNVGVPGHVIPRICFDFVFFCKRTFIFKK